MTIHFRKRSRLKEGIRFEYAVPEEAIGLVEYYGHWREVMWIAAFFSSITNGILRLALFVNWFFVRRKPMFAENRGSGSEPGSNQLPDLGLLLAYERAMKCPVIGAKVLPATTKFLRLKFRHLPFAVRSQGAPADDCFEKDLG